MAPHRSVKNDGSSAAPSAAGTAVLAAVAERNRVQLLRLLLDGERCVAQCMEETGLLQSLVSKHLGRLIDAGLVQRRREGRLSYHSVVDPRAVKQLLDLAEELAALQQPR